MKDSRVLLENKLIEEFVTEVSKKSGKAVYGLEQIQKALGDSNISKLLVIDSLLFEKRDEIEPLLDHAEKTGASVHLISHENDLSEKVNSFGGIVGLKRY